MSFSSWFPFARSGSSRPRASHPARRRAAHRLSIEPLEDRCLLASVIVDPTGAPVPPTDLTNVNGTLFFVTYDPTDAALLWKATAPFASSDFRVLHYFSPTLSWKPSSLTNVNGTLFFTAGDSAHGTELWKSDGTAAGTVLVKDINPGSASAFAGGGADALVEVNGVLFFTAFNPEGSSNPANLINADGTLFFSASHPETGGELWASDGTEKGTFLVKDINPGTGSSGPTLLTLVNGTLFFAASTPETGHELWASDGSAEGTFLVQDINPGSASAFTLDGADFLVDVNGVLFFTASTPETGHELWRSDGSAEGTFLVQDINPGSASAFAVLVIFPGDPVGVSFPAVPSVPIPTVVPVTRPVVLDGVLLFVADDGSSGRELWRSDGTAAGTFQLRDIYPGAGYSFPQYLTVVGGTLFFTAFDPDHGFELWRSDGTPEGTILVKDLRPGPIGSFPMSLVEMDGMLFFGGIGPVVGGELWQSDGTPEGTARIFGTGFVGMPVA